MVAHNGGLHRDALGRALVGVVALAPLRQVGRQALHQGLEVARVVVHQSQGAEHPVAVLCGAVGGLAVVGYDDALAVLPLGGAQVHQAYHLVVVLLQFLHNRLQPERLYGLVLLHVLVDELQPLLNLRRLVAQGGLRRGLVQVEPRLHLLRGLLHLRHTDHLQHRVHHRVHLVHAHVAGLVGLVNLLRLRRHGRLLVVVEQLLHQRLRVRQIGLQLGRRGVLLGKNCVVAAHPSRQVAHGYLVGPGLCVDGRYSLDCYVHIVLLFSPLFNDFSLRTAPCGVHRPPFRLARPSMWGTWSGVQPCEVLHVGYMEQVSALRGAPCGVHRALFTAACSPNGDRRRARVFMVRLRVHNP